MSNIENVGGRGSMYGAVDTLRHMTKAMEELLEHLPADFVWPTMFDVSAHSGYIEWGRDDSTAAQEPAVWMVASPEGVHMNASFRPNWPDVEALDFNAAIAAGWLKDLTRNWIWGANRDGGITSAHVQRNHMNAGQFRI